MSLIDGVTEVSGHIRVLYLGVKVFLTVLQIYEGRDGRQGVHNGIYDRKIIKVSPGVSKAGHERGFDKNVVGLDFVDAIITVDEDNGVLFEVGIFLIVGRVMFYDG